MFLKYWHTDVLETLLKPYDTAIIKVQSLARKFIARCRFIPILQKYRDQMAAVANFLVDVRTSSKDTLYNLEVSSVCVCVLGGGGGWELCVY